MVGEKQEEELQIAVQGVKIALDVVRMLQEVYAFPEETTLAELKDALMEMYRKITDDI